MSTTTAPALGALQTIPLEQLRPDRKNIRKDMGDLGQLADSIRELGILDPLQVTAHASMAGDYQVIDGHRRLQAAKRAGLTELPCIVKDGPDKATRLKTMLATGLTHKTLNPVEEASGIQQMLDLGETIASIARTTGRTQKDLKAKHKLIGLPKEAETAVVAQTMTVEQAVVLQDFADDPEATERLLAAVEERNWNWAVRNEQKLRRLPGFLEEARAAIEASGAKSIPNEGRYNGRYHRVGDEDSRSALDYTPGSLGASVQAHAEAKHVYHLDESWGRLEWFEPVKVNKPPKPALTPEQVEEAERLRRFTAGLEISHQTEMEHLTAFIGNKNALDADGKFRLLREMADHIIWRDRDLTIRLLDLKHFRDADYQAETDAIRSAVHKLNADQLISLFGVMMLGQPDLKKPRGWEHLDGYNQAGRDWLEIRETVYGRPLDAMETEVREHYRRPADDDASAYDQAEEENEADDDAA